MSVRKSLGGCRTFDADFRTAMIQIFLRLSRASVKSSRYYWSVGVADGGYVVPR